MNGRTFAEVRCDVGHRPPRARWGRALERFGIAGFIAFAGAALGVWWVKIEVNRRTDTLAAKANTAVDAGDHAVAFVREVIDRADDDLDSARKTATAAPRESVHPFVHLAALQASQNLAGSVQRASAAVVVASDAVVVGESAVELLGEDGQLKNWLGVKPEQLGANANRPGRRVARVEARADGPRHSGGRGRAADRGTTGNSGIRARPGRGVH